jgi:hypothetical protein
MFALSSDDLHGRILGCADSPASFNAEATAAGLSVTSCDPLYRFTAAEIARRVAETTEVIIDYTRRNRHEFVWTSICSIEELRHFLFLYSEQLSKDFHVAAIREMGRVAQEVRIFPLLTLGGPRSPHIEPVTRRLQIDGVAVIVETVAYEFQRGGNQMMRVKDPIEGE